MRVLDQVWDANAAEVLLRRATIVDKASTAADLVSWLPVPVQGIDDVGLAGDSLGGFGDWKCRAIDPGVGSLLCTRIETGDHASADLSSCGCRGNGDLDWSV